jgi:hypothetical protein
MRLVVRGEMAAGTNEGMPKLLSLAAALLMSAALTTTPALAAEPATATATFEEALFSPVDGILDFEETADGIKVIGKFQKGFASGHADDYMMQVRDNASVVVDFSKDFQKVAEISPPAVDEFEFTTKTKQKIAAIRGEDVVIRQLVDLAGIKVQAEIGRTKIVR